MGALASFSIKQQDGSYKNYTIAIDDKTNEYGKNVSVYEEQTKEQREAKEKKKFLGSGKVFWTSGSVNVAEKKDAVKKEAATVSDDLSGDLPF